MAGIFGYVPNNTLGALYLTPQTGNEALWRQALANQGSISKTRPSLGGRLENLTVDTLRKAGVSDRAAARLGSKTFSAINDLTPVGDVISADDARRAFKQGNYLQGAGLGAISLLGMVPGLGDTAAGAAKAMFLGPMARNADLKALKQAKGMFGGGVDRHKILNETGWFQGADNKWRFELDDSPMRLDESKLSNQPIPLRDAVHHPELFRAYDLSNLKIAKEETPGLGGRMGVNTLFAKPTTELITGTAPQNVAHELQHHIQSIEGFSLGGQPGLPGVYSEGSPYIAGLKDNFARLAARGNAGLEDVEFALDQLAHKIDKEGGIEGYRRLAGEVEARTVANRLNWPDDWRRSRRAPWEMWDYPAEQQILRPDPTVRRFSQQFEF